MSKRDRLLRRESGRGPSLEGLLRGARDMASKRGMFLDVKGVGSRQTWVLLSASSGAVVLRYNPNNMVWTGPDGTESGRVRHFGEAIRLAQTRM